MKIYGADADTIKNEILSLREKLVTAKTVAEEQLCISDIELLNVLYNCLTHNNVEGFNKIFKNNRGKLINCSNFYNKLNDTYNNKVIANKDFINYLSSRSLNVYAKELYKYIDKDIIEEEIFNEDDASIILHSFFRKYHPKDVDFVDEIILNKRVLRTDILDKYCGLCFYVYKSLPFLVVENPRYSVKTIKSLIHELGHAIDFKNMNDNFSVNKIEKYLEISPYIEVNSRLYEKEALEFFIDEDINKDYAVTLLADYHYTNYSYLLDSYFFTLLPDYLLEKNKYYNYSMDELKLFIPFDKYNSDIFDTIGDEKINLSDSFNYGIGGLIATILSSKIKEDKDSGNVLYNKFMSNRMDSFRPSIFDELGIDYKEASKCLKKEINYLVKNSFPNS